MTRDNNFHHITVTELHPTFGAEVSGVDISTPLSDEVQEEISRAIAKYGVLLFRETYLNEQTHVEFAARFGELDDATPYMTKMSSARRPTRNELWDISNVNSDGTLADPEGIKAQSHKSKLLSYSLLLAHELPPPGTGGETAFADTRTAFDELPADPKEDLVKHDSVAQHSIVHSRKLAVLEYFKDTNPEDFRWDGIGLCISMNRRGE